jgi:ketosteroid isomerase-like protein
LTDVQEPSGNAAAMRRSIEAYNSGDLDALLATAHPDIEWEVAPEHPAATTHRGFDAVLEYHDDWRNTLQGLTIELRSVAERGDAVVTVCRLRGRGEGSGAEVEVEIALLTTFRDGKAIRVEEFLDPDEALRALESTSDDS